jgi:hypothetical protein
LENNEYVPQYIVEALSGLRNCGVRRMNWKEIESGLQGLSAADEMPDTATFQAEAKSKARDIIQDSRESADSPGLIPGWVFAMACALIMAGIIGFQFRPRTPVPDDGPMLAQNTEITELHVHVELSAVFITNDSDSQATIIWIAGLEPQSGG